MLGSIFKTLDMNFENGLVYTNTENLPTYQQLICNMVQEKLGINAIYFLRDTDGTPKIPLIYFAAMDRYDIDAIADLHRLAWNLGDAPLLFVVTPERLLIYNNYAAPRRTENGSLDATAGLLETLEIINSLELQRQLLQYHRIKLETGEFWRDPQNSGRFDTRNRVDVTLMSNLRFMRHILIHNIRSRYSTKDLADEKLVAIVHALLGRSILIKYLEERTDKNGETVFPKDFFSHFKSHAKSYVDLLDNKDAAYSLFKELAHHFNGDMFPLVNREYEIISTEDLIELKTFLQGNMNYENQQLLLWPLYSFNIIPIQLISSIYELFFHLKVDDKAGRAGTYYTPYHLVSMLVDEVLPWEGVYEKMKIMDPACGSGIFLVEAYRRLIGKWIYSNKPKRIDSVQLKNILKNCIYGVDKNGEAVRIASFSLSLVMCDYLEPRNIWKSLTFPRLLGYNLFENDFFDNGKFEEQTYDIIIGNPPWESKLTSFAKKYIKDTKLPIGDKQIAQAFTWKAGELCSEDGTVCLLMPSKGFLFNRWPNNLAYRKSFFEKYYVSVIINYSIFRKKLFAKATAPATAVVYSPRFPGKDTPIFYCTPKPTFTIEDRRRFLVEPVDIRRLPRDAVENPLIWKIAMWGTPRDMELINKLETKFYSVSEFLENNHMIYAEGLIEGGERQKKKDYPEYINWRIISTEKFNAFSLPEFEQNKVKSTRFYRGCSSRKTVFTAPHLVFKQSPKSGRFLSAVLNYDALFVNSFVGIHGNEQLLKYLSIVFYSRIFVYYSLMTSRKWLVERDELNVEELLSFPIPTPTNKELESACAIYDRNSGSQPIDTKQIDDYVYALYQLRDYEIELVENAVSNIYDYFYGKGKSASVAAPSTENLEYYIDILKQVLQNSVGFQCPVSTIYYQGQSPLVVVQVIFNNSVESTCITEKEETDSLLTHLDNLLLSERSGSVYIKRNVRVYNRDSIYIIKPNQSRYWSYASACNDADEIYAEIMRAWRENREQN